MGRNGGAKLLWVLVGVAKLQEGKLMGFSFAGG